MTKHEQLDSSMTNHTPTSQQVQVIERLRAEAKQLGAAILELTPASREQSLAITRLEESLMWSVKGCILNGIVVVEQQRQPPMKDMRETG